MEAKRSIANPVLFIENTHRGPWQETFAIVEGFDFSLSFYQKRNKH